MMPNSGHIMTLANSIIGVGILAMPFCFQKCGIVLSILLLIINNLVTRISCHYLIKSSVITRRKSFEFLAFHAFGSSGKLMVELCIIGYLLGTCIAYFVVVGDLGPQIISKIFNLNDNLLKLRSWIMILVTFSCIIPLGLLRNVDSLSVVCTASIGFYFCLVFKVISESSIQFVDNYWTKNIDYWKPSGILQCLPIFSMALACQIQLFEVLETLPNPSIEKMNHVVNAATMICTYVYILVGFFGYVAFSNQSLSGNILVHLSTSLASDAIKMGFVLSIAFSFPLVIFPCRASIYSLLYRKGHADANGYIPEFRFKIITISIILFSLFIGLLIPSVELVIGLVGSTIGIAICVMFPSLCFMKIFKKDNNEKSLAQLILVSGFCLMILGTYANLNAIDEKHSGLVLTKSDNENYKLIQNNRYKNITDNIKSNNKDNIPPLSSSSSQTFSNVQENNKSINLTKTEDKKKISGTSIKLSKSVENDEIVDTQFIKKNYNQKTLITETPKIINVEKNEKNSNKNDNKKIEIKKDEILKQNTNKQEIDKDAIKKEDEITAEEEEKNKNKKLKINNDNVAAANELEITKELLEKKVDELKEQLAKQNVETQNLVVEQLGDIVQKVKRIEQKVYQQDKLSLNNDNINLNISTNNKTNDNLINNNEQNKNKLEITVTQKSVINEKNIKKLKKEENIKIEENIEIKKTEKIEKQQQPLPLPLLINATNLIKQTTRNTEDIENNMNKKTNNNNQEKILNDNKNNEITNLKKDKENIKNNPEENNIESIRRDILEVASDNDLQMITSSPLPSSSSSLSNKNDKKIQINDNLREKRELSKDICINWDVVESNCLDDIQSITNKNNNNNNKNQNLNSKNNDNDKTLIQSIGRDLKSV